MKKLLQNRYSTPAIEVEELEVERGFFQSSDYGNIGEAGQNSSYINDDVEL